MHNENNRGIKRVQHSSSSSSSNQLYRLTNEKNREGPSSGEPSYWHGTSSSTPFWFCAGGRRRLPSYNRALVRSCAWLSLVTLEAWYNVHKRFSWLKNGLGDKGVIWSYLWFFRCLFFMYYLWYVALNQEFLKWVHSVWRCLKRKQLNWFTLTQDNNCVWCTIQVISSLLCYWMVGFWLCCRVVGYVIGYVKYYSVVYVGYAWFWLGCLVTINRWSTTVVKVQL